MVGAMLFIQRDWNLDGSMLQFLKGIAYNQNFGESLVSKS